MAGDHGKAFELEGMVTALGVLRILTEDLTAIGAGLEQKIASSPVLFKGAALVLDLSALDGQDGEEGKSPLRIAALVQLLRTHGLVAVGVRGANAGRRDEASAAGLGHFESQSRKSTRPNKNELVPETPVGAASDTSKAVHASKPPRPEPAPDATSASAGFAALMLTQPLRSGQIVYAEQRDAVVLAAVNPGAELIADGNIHVYGSLRGRALAGARGDEQARIFCQRLDADLISIAGVYLSAEQLPEDKRGRPAQISLQHGELIISPLT